MRDRGLHTSPLWTSNLSHSKAKYQGPCKHRLDHRLAQTKA